MNSNENWELKIDDVVYKELARFPKRNAKKIFKVIELLPFDPYAGDIEKIKNEESVWRRRIGAYRIFYEIKKIERIIEVFRVERRTSNTY